MAVYTLVPPAALDGFLAAYDLGRVASLEPIAEGVSNTNYRLTAARGLYVLTLFEARTEEAALPFFLALMAHLAKGGLACPLPVAGRDGQALRPLCGRQAALQTWLVGQPAASVTPAHARAVGAALARLHTLAATFPGLRANSLGPPAWRGLIAPCLSRLDDILPGARETLLAVLEDAEDFARLPHGSPPVGALPRGIIHADLFPDNVLFSDSAVTGLIDFYFAATDYLAYDLMIAVNAWAFDDQGGYDPALGAALLAGYHNGREITATEARALPIFGQMAALRFTATRLHDWFHRKPGALVTTKDPQAFWKRLLTQRAFTDFTDYGWTP